MHITIENAQLSFGALASGGVRDGIHRSLSRNAYFGRGIVARSQTGTALHVCTGARRITDTFESGREPLPHRAAVDEPCLPPPECDKLVSYLVDEDYATPILRGPLVCVTRSATHNHLAFVQLAAMRLWLRA